MVLKASLSDILPFWGQLDEQEQHLAQDSAALHSYEDGDPICRGGDGCMGMVYVMSGGLRAFMLSPEGREITLYRVRAGELCLLTAACALKALTFDAHVKADGETSLTVIGVDAFRRLMECNVHVEAFAYKVLTGRFSQVMFVLQQMLFVRFDRRLAAFLLEEAEKAGSLSLKVTHEQIAGYLGSAREVVTRMLGYFAQEGLVSISRGAVTIMDRERLKLIAQA